MKKLTKIANKYTVDKGTEYYEKHSYTEVYDIYIPDEGKYNLLEIGVWHGDSLKMWSEYNNDLNICGVDIDSNVYNYIKETENIKIYIGDQSDVDFLNNLTKEIDVFNFIIDDGSHMYNDIYTSFINLFDFLSDDGYYFIEDLHAICANKDKLLENIILWLNENNKLYKGYELVCDNKLLIIKK